MSWSYAAIMFAAVATGVVLSRWTQRPLGLAVSQRVAIGLGAFCGAMIGAKLPFVLSDWDGMISGQAWFESGKTIVFGLVGGYVGVEIAKWSIGLRTKTGDSFAVPVAAAIAVGRLACFSAGCCFGTVTSLPWGVDFSRFAVATTASAAERLTGDATPSTIRDGPLDRRPRHPTQLYEFAFHVAAAAALARLQQRGVFRGQLIKLYIVTYLGYRFATEFIRPEPLVCSGFTAYQLASAAFIPVFVLLWIHDSRRFRKSVARGDRG